MSTRTGNNAATQHIVELVRRSPIVERYLDERGRVTNWLGLIHDPSLSSGEQRLLKLAYRIGRENGDIAYDPDASPEAQVLDADIFDVLSNVDRRHAKHAIEALWYMYGVGSGMTEHPLEECIDV